MKQYIIRRFISMFPIFIGITIILFIFANMVPGGPASLRMSAQQNPTDYARIKANLGLDDPLAVRYIKWIGKVVRLDLGISNWSKRPIDEVLWEKIPFTLSITGLAFIIAVTFSVLLGILAAARHHSITDYLVSIVSFTGISVPEFWLATVLIVIFHIKLDWLPSMGIKNLRAETSDIWDRIRHLILPVTCVSAPTLAIWTRHMRSGMLEILKEDYIRTARSKGLREKVIVFKHALRNAMIPMITLAGLTIPNLIVGSFIVDIVFSLPGIGLEGLNAIRRKDTYVLLGINIIVTLLVLISNFTADICYVVVDPRIRYD